MRLAPLTLIVVLSGIAGAQVPDTTRRVPSGVVTGIVRDSIARVPLSGAVVQMVSAGAGPVVTRTDVSDSLGRYTLLDVPNGQYQIGFLHAILDSLGVEPPLREVNLTGEQGVTVDLAIPSAARLRAAICGAPSAVGADSGAVVMGFVRSASTRAPIAGASVVGQWLEYSFRPGGVNRRVPRLVARTGPDGWFALCNVPRGGTMELRAGRAADSTAMLVVQVPEDGFLRRDLYLGVARSASARDGIARVDTVQAAEPPVAAGAGRLSGTVIADSDGRPLVGAQVRLAAGPQTIANERGEWALVNAPSGTQMLEVRAVGYYPEVRPVDVIAGAPPVRVAMSTLKAVLDTVMVRGRLTFDRRQTGFEDRRRTGLGRYLTPTDILRRQPEVISDLFRMIPGLSVEIGADGFEKQILMRSDFSETCVPAFFLNGLNLRVLSIDDIDAFADPRSVTGIEIYVNNAPPQFQQGLSGCGSIVIWTK